MYFEEEWRPVVGYEGLYEVSSFGQVRSVDRVVTINYREGQPGGKMRRYKSRIKKQSQDPRGYTYVHLSKNNKAKNGYVHSLVAEAFIGPRPEGMHVCHGPAGPGCPAIWNVSYGTPEDNHKDRVRDGTDVKGENHFMARLSEDDVRKIFAAKGGEKSGSQIAKEYGLTKGAVYNIWNGRAWTHVTGMKNIRNY